MPTEGRAKSARRAPRRHEPEIISPRRGAFLISGIVAAAALAAYGNSFSGPFIFDDSFAVGDNGTLRGLWTALTPPIHSTVGGRPLLNLSFALNYAWGGYAVWGYHAFNLVVHVLAAVTLCGIVRRTLLRPVLRERFGAYAPVLALITAVLWAVHPLQTEAVTYISQRAESLMALFYLLTLYAFVLGVDSAAPAGWQLLSVAACMLGALVKENIVTAPLMVLLYDRTFVAGSFGEAWRQRWRYYLALMAMWLLLAWMMSGLSDRGVGFGQGVTAWSYAQASCESVATYLKLAVWPHPLVLDYGARVALRPVEVARCAAAIAALLAVSAVALRRWPAAGFACAWFFVILAPTSSIIPVPLQPTAEHRVYLSLASVVALAVAGWFRLTGRKGLVALALVAVAFVWLTAQRNEDYRSAGSIWTDTVAKVPGNVRARGILGNVLASMPGRRREAVFEYAVALRIDPRFSNSNGRVPGAPLAISGAQLNQIAEMDAALRSDPDLLVTDENIGRIPAALDEETARYEAILRLAPEMPEAHRILGNILSKSFGMVAEATAEYQEALRLAPDNVDAHIDLGAVLAKTPGRLGEAVAQFNEALRLRPDFAEAHNNLGNALERTPGRLDEAIAQYGEALRLKPDYAEAHNNLAIALGAGGRSDEAIAQYKEALRLNPDYAEAYNNLGNALDAAGRSPEAVVQYGEALRLRPDNAGLHNNLAHALQNIPGRMDDAIAQYDEALRLKPGIAAIHVNLAAALLKMPNRTAEAAAQLREALRLQPNNGRARDMLAGIGSPGP
jgi:tetratricopeptide (TPR) repeat protein